ncbi:hypothetical protein FA95DRAFT_1541691 [Auriscalpium vulgare]|uniref:Uncharacterized protein n=1 Tax=Auriscalpium vulgare TaxID=40419 RepID=A0ACB8RU49_9AGAM|nr:hypothetical protein FA95DRAFT_1541691 [Auriscalpium vulgare]
MIPFDKASIIATGLEAVLYGVSVPMYGATMWFLFQRRRGYVNWPMVVAASLFFLFSTVHIAIAIHRLVQGFVENRSFPGGPSAWFNDVSQLTFVLESAIYSAQTLLGDGILIYRCSIVWRSVWVLVFPIIMWCGLLATCVGTVRAVAQTNLHGASFLMTSTARWITAFYATTMATNGVCTLLLTLRIWHVDLRVRRLRTSQSALMPIGLIILDAGVLYSITLLAALITFVCKWNGRVIMLNTVTPIISIAFYMVIVRLGMRRVSAPSGGGISHSVSTAHRSIPMQVHISQTSTKDYPDSGTGTGKSDDISKTLPPASDRIHSTQV